MAIKSGFSLKIKSKISLSEKREKVLALSFSSKRQTPVFLFSLPARSIPKIFINFVEDENDQKRKQNPAQNIEGGMKTGINNRKADQKSQNQKEKPKFFVMEKER